MSAIGLLQVARKKEQTRLGLDSSRVCRHIFGVKAKLTTWSGHISD
jgi:hypothetical protein